ncbi:MAG TPA: carboxypeptidase-like regulatory domain-containing protein [Candidatus Limnocylindrales bacterium]|nr:carboxypeptidase-like regulatory domain-containing protein [Candidatus Limnocylindrales bacterium]
MSPAPEVAGRFTVAESGGQVSLKGIGVGIQGPASAGAVSDSAGKFTFSRLYPGSWSISAINSLPDGCYVRELKFRDQEISWDRFDISASGPLEILLSTTAAQIAGTVSDTDGKPFPISTVVLIPADGKTRSAKQTVDDNGNFRFTHLRPGTYKLFAWQEVDDDLWPDAEFRKKYENRAVDVTVAARESKTVQLRVIPFEAMK